MKRQTPFLLCSLFSLTLAPAVSADEVHFEGLATGTILGSVSSQGGVGPILVSGFNPSLGNVNAAVVFDSANPTGGDQDLGTPHTDFGGPGVGSGGQQGSPNENNTALGKILIVDEHLVTGQGGLVVDPDDASVAGVTLEFDFSQVGTSTMYSVEYMDVEDDQSAMLELFDASNNSLGVFPMPGLGNNGVGSVNVQATAGVERVLISLGGSGAITGFNFDVDCTGSIGDYVWEDVDGDGIQDAAEPGLVGVDMLLTDMGGQVLDQTTTVANGFYEFKGLCAGNYKVEVVSNTLPDGLVASPCMAGNDDTADNNCSPATVSLSANNSVRTDIDFGYIPEPFVYCDSNVNSTGLEARIDYNGSTSITTNNFEIVVSDLPANKPGYLFYGFDQASIPFGDGVRCIGGPLYRYEKVPSTGPQGMVTIPLDFSLPPLSSGNGQVVPGQKVYFQLWYRDPAGTAGFNSTGGICVTFAP